MVAQLIRSYSNLDGRFKMIAVFMMTFLKLRGLLGKKAHAANLSKTALLLMLVCHF